MRCREEYRNRTASTYTAEERVAADGRLLLTTVDILGPTPEAIRPVRVANDSMSSVNLATDRFVDGNTILVLEEQECAGAIGGVSEGNNVTVVYDDG